MTVTLASCPTWKAGLSLSATFASIHMVEMSATVKGAGALPGCTKSPGAALRAVMLMKLNLLVVAGDGIGPEVTNEAVSVLQTVAAAGGHEIAVTEKRIGGIAIDTDGTPLPADTLTAALASDAVFLGAVGGTKWNALPPNTRPEAGLLQLRAALGGFANLRPAFAIKELATNSPLRTEVTEGAD